MFALLPQLGLAVTFDFESGTTGSGTNTVSQAVSSNTLTLTGTANTLYIDNASNSGIITAGNFSGNFAFNNLTGACESKVVVALQSGYVFDLSTIDLLDTSGDTRPVFLTGKNGASTIGATSTTITGNGAAHVDVSSNGAFQGITSVEITATGSNGTCAASTFSLAFDNVVLANIHVPASTPSATTGSASSITATGATLNGTVNDNGATTTVTFDYGLTTAYGSNVAASTGGTVSAGAGSTAVSKALTGLSCNTTYHYRVKATNVSGTTNGSDASLTTSACVPGAPTIGTATAGSGQASVSFTAPASNGGSAITGYTVTSSPGAITATGPSSPIVVTGLTNGTAYTFTVTATNSAGTGSASGASNSVTPKAAQTITFNNPGTQNFGTTPTLSATATSSLTVSFSSSTTGVCTITSGGTLSFVTSGTCTIDADQAGNATYLAATRVTQSFTVSAVVPGAPTIGTATAGDGQASVAFTAPASNGGATISGYTVTSNPGGITGTGASSPITVSGLTNGTAYTFTVTATNSAGTGGASGASASVTPKGTQTITFNNPGAQNFGTTPTLTATASSSLTVSFSSSTTGVCTTTTGGALTFVTAGTCTINADQAGNATWLAAPQVSRSFSVNAVVPGAPTIGTATAGNTQASVAFTAPASNGGATISGYTVTSNPGGISGTGASSPITVTGLTNGTAYSFSVTATNSAGTGGASGASNSVTPAASQTITFNNPGAQNFGTTPTLSATASSGLTVSFSSSTTAVCTITTGGALTFLTAGTCTINADQSGNAAYIAAPQVSRSFSVNAVVPGAPTIGTATAGNTQASVAFTAPASNGGATISGYTVTSNPGGITGTGASSPITVSGLTNGTAYTFTVTATNGAGTGSPSGASNSVTPNPPSSSGACGSADGVASAFMPTANLCASGTPTTVDAASPWAWHCNGSGPSGTNASCSAPNASTGSGASTGRAEIAGDNWAADARQSAGFIPTSGNAKSPPSLPPGYQFPQALLDFVLTGGTHGSTATVVLTFSSVVPANAVYWKYGPSPSGYNCSGTSCASAHWYRMPSGQVAISGNTVTLTIQDGGVGDDDLSANGTIVDVGGIAVTAAGPVPGATAIPTMSEWGRIVMSALLALTAVMTLRRRGD